MGDRLVDVLIVGGGGAGLWLLDRFRREGFVTLLVENSALGAGQTIASQGIIHGGLKYTLSGLLNASARAIRDMPELWRRCLAGETSPDLSNAVIRSQRCCLWRSKSIGSRIGMLGAQKGLRSAAEKLADGDRPTILRNCPGEVFSVEEQVLDVASVLEALTDSNNNHIVTGEVSLNANTMFVDCTISNQGTDRTIGVEARYVVLTAGAGNAVLREQLGLPATAMQRRPLHMVMVRGDLPELYGHCVDWDKTRATITSAVNRNGQMVWYVGGQVSEDGVKMEANNLIRHARSELADIIPGWRDRNFEWSTLRIDRAELKTTGGIRPSGPEIIRNGSIITAWPTKLALVPELSNMICDVIDSPSGCDDAWLNEISDWPRPSVAAYPWEGATQWRRMD